MNRQSGNVLFLILIAVVLFAALSYAVTRSSRDGGRDISDEDAKLTASQLANFAVSVRTTVDRLRLAGGCSLAEISFNDYFTVAGTGYFYGQPSVGTNPKRRADGGCDVFGPAGRAVPMLKSDKICSRDVALDQCQISFFKSPVIGIGMDPANSSDPGGAETYIWIRYVNPKVCAALRAGNGIPPVTGENGHYFVGPYDETGVAPYTIGQNDTELRGKDYGCYLQGASSKEYDAYFVVMTR